MQNQNNQSRSQSSNKSKGASDSSSESEQKSIGAVIGDSLAKDTQERIDEVMTKVNSYFKSAKDYVAENPKETAAIAAAVAVAGWALFYTKPGRSLFDKGAGVFVPQVSKWITENLGSTGASVTKH